MQDLLDAAREALDRFAADDTNARTLEVVADRIAQCFTSGGKLLACGNGGSLTQAMHLAEELTGRFKRDRRPLPALACTDGGHLTCTANDYGYESVFERWVSALARPGDVVVFFSTSGNSENISRAERAAREAGATTVALLGKGGGEMAGRCDHEWLCPGEGSERVQEIHLVILHALIEGVERRLFEHD